MERAPACCNDTGRPEQQVVSRKARRPRYLPRRIETFNANALAKAAGVVR